MAWREHFTNGRSLMLGTGLAVMGFGALFQASHPTIAGCLYGFGLAVAVLAALQILKSYLSPELAREPIVKVCALIPASLHMEDMKWRQQHDGAAGVLAVVTNMPSTSSSQGGKAEGLAASLSFDDSSGSQIFIEKAYWLDRLENSLDLTVGSSRRVLIGVVDDSHLRVFGNTHEEDPRPSEEPDKHMIYVTHGQALRFSDDMNVTIRLYSVQTGKIFDTKTLRVPHGMEIVSRM